MARPSCNGPLRGLLPWCLRVATVDPLECCHSPSDLQRSTGLLQWPLRVAMVHTLDCCNGLSELQQSTPWTVAMASPSYNAPLPGLLTGFSFQRYDRILFSKIWSDSVFKDIMDSVFECICFKRYGRILFSRIWPDSVFGDVIGFYCQSYINFKDMRRFCFQRYERIWFWKIWPDSDFKDVRIIWPARASLPLPLTISHKS